MAAPNFNYDKSTLQRVRILNDDDAIPLTVALSADDINVNVDTHVSINSETPLYVTSTTEDPVYVMSLPEDPIQVTSTTEDPVHVILKSSNALLKDFWVGIAEGTYPNAVPFLKIGFNPAIATTREDVWSAGDTYVFPTTATRMEVLSSDNTQDIGTVIRGDAVGDTVQSDPEGSTTTLVDDDVDFLDGTAVEAGDCVILDPHGTTPEWGYVTSVAQHTLTIANGFSSGGTGASRYYAVVDKSAYTNGQVVKLGLLDANYVPKEEIVVLNGTTPVATVNSYLRINSLRTIAVGSAGQTLGNITLRGISGGTTYSYMLAGACRARNSAYTVPAAATLYIYQWNISAATPIDSKVQSARCTIRVNVEPGTEFNTGTIFHTVAESLVSNGAELVSFNIPIRIPEKTDIKCSAVGLTGFNGPVTSALRGWLETISD